jgi:hypothetical protein
MDASARGSSSTQGRVTASLVGEEQRRLTHALRSSRGVRLPRIVTTPQLMV